LNASPATKRQHRAPRDEKEFLISGLVHITLVFKRKTRTRNEKDFGGNSGIECGLCQDAELLNALLNAGISFLLVFAFEVASLRSCSNATRLFG
jgi:hypothetical protein